MDRSKANVITLLALAAVVLACNMPATTTSPNTPTPEPSLTETPMPVCTPPLCEPDEQYYCPDECPGGCGTICVTPTPTEEPTQTPTATLEPPTPTEEPTATMEPPTPTETTALPTPSCEQKAWGWFEGALELVPGVREKIGCPADDHQDLTAATQDFEHGYMVWREDERLIYVFHDFETWESHPDHWEEGMPERDLSLGPPPEGKIQPKRGFGLIWQEHPTVRERLGWALNEERLCDKAHCQPFQHGLMLECMEDVVPRARIRIFVLFEDHTYTLYSPP
jgi:hypothetical protein